MISKKVLYFAYGSNMDYDRIAYRIDNPICLGAYRINDYVLKFNCGYGGVRYANAAKEKGKFIEGVLYDISERDISILDKHECYGHNYIKEYFYDKQKDVIIMMYVATEFFLDKENKLPELYYLNFLLKGAAQNNLEYTYNFLTEYKKKNYNLKKGIKDFRRK